MKDMGKTDELEVLLSNWLAPNVERLAVTLHRDFVAFGCEEGLFVRADAPMSCLGLGARTCLRPPLPGSIGVMSTEHLQLRVSSRRYQTQSEQSC